MINLAENSYDIVKNLEVFLEDKADVDRNIELYKRNTHPWYILATMSQDQSAEAINPDAQINNRIFWNRFMCGDLPPARKKELSKKLSLPLGDFVKFTEKEWDELEKALERCPVSHMISALKKWKSPRTGDRPLIQFCNINFGPRSIFDGFIFNGIAEFSNSVFTGDTSFRDAYFLQRVDFSRVKFNAPVNFEGTEFSGDTDFTLVKFKNEASYKNTLFNKTTVFKGSIFDLSADFSDAKFLGTTSFDKTQFKNRAPRFFNSNLYEDTIFSVKDELWPEARSSKSKDHERAYARLRRYMTDIKKPDEEGFFHKLEMREKASSQDHISSFLIKSFDVISIFGQSIWRPLAFLAVIIFLGWLSIAPWAHFGSASSNPLFDAFIWSLSNSLPLVKTSAVVNFSDIPPWTRLFSVAQSIVSAILLFLVVLAIRNKFRIK